MSHIFALSLWNVKKSKRHKFIFQQAPSTFVLRFLSFTFSYAIFLFYCIFSVFFGNLIFSIFLIQSYPCNIPLSWIFLFQSSPSIKSLRISLSLTIFFFYCSCLNPYKKSFSGCTFASMNADQMSHGFVD